MDDRQDRDYDAMFAQSQINPFIKEDEAKGESYDAQFRKSYAKKEKGAKKSPENPEVLDATGRPINPKRSGMSAHMMGLISLIIGGVALVMVFAGMFFHALLWLNLLLCIVGIGFGAASVFKNSLDRVPGILGILLCLFVLLVDIICLIITAVISGAAALIHLVNK